MEFADEERAVELKATARRGSRTQKWGRGCACEDSLDAGTGSGHGHVWPVAFALKELTVAEELRIAALVKRAAT